MVLLYEELEFKDKTISSLKPQVVRSLQKLFEYEWKWLLETALWYSPPSVSPNWHEPEITERMKAAVFEKLTAEFLKEGRALQIISINVSFRWEWLYYDYERYENAYRCYVTTTTFFKTDIPDVDVHSFVVSAAIISIIKAVIIVVGIFIAGYFLLENAREIGSWIKAVPEALAKIPKEIIYGVLIVAGLIGTAIVIKAVKER